MRYSLLVVYATDVGDRKSRLDPSDLSSLLECEDDMQGGVDPRNLEMRYRGEIRPEDLARDRSGWTGACATSGHSSAAFRLLYGNSASRPPNSRPVSCHPNCVHDSDCNYSTYWAVLLKLCCTRHTMRMKGSKRVKCLVSFIVVRSCLRTIFLKAHRPLVGW